MGNFCGSVTLLFRVVFTTVTNTASDCISVKGQGGKKHQTTGFHVYEDQDTARWSQLGPHCAKNYKKLNLTIWRPCITPAIKLLPVCQAQFSRYYSNPLHPHPSNIYLSKQFKVWIIKLHYCFDFQSYCMWLPQNMTKSMHH